MSNTNNKQIFLSPPWTGREEIAAVKRAFESGYVAPCGPQVDEFERRLANLSGRQFAIAVSSGTAAMDLLMEEFCVDRYTTVIAPTLTFIATVGPAWHRGARIAFVDCDKTGNIDLRLLEVAIKEEKARLSKSRRDKNRLPPYNRQRIVVIASDLYGRCFDYWRIQRCCHENGANLIADCAESVGATREGRPSGSFGDAAIFSFNGNKIVTTSGGGAILTNNAEVNARLRKQCQQSREPVPWYEHKEVGYNYRMSNLLAAVGIAQLKKLPKILKKRARIAAWYAKHAKGLEPLPPVEGENHWLTVMLAESEAARDGLLQRLAKARIEARPVWKPLHLQPVFKKCRVYGGEVAEDLFRRGICLPSGTGLTAADLARIGKNL